MSEAAVTRAEFEALKAELTELRAQMAALLPASTTAAGNGKKDEISEETILILSAAIAAYLGKRATIKFVRLRGGDTAPWRAQAGVTIAASHRMPRSRGW